MLIDGIGQGSVRPMDPPIAGQTIMSTINSAFEMRPWIARSDDPRRAVETYCWTLAHGLFRDPPNRAARPREDYAAAGSLGSRTRYSVTSAASASAAALAISSGV